MTLLVTKMDLGTKYGTSDEIPANNLHGHKSLTGQI